MTRRQYGGTLAGILIYVGMRWWERRKLEHLTLPEPKKVISGAR